MEKKGIILILVLVIVAILSVSVYDFLSYLKVRRDLAILRKEEVKAKYLAIAGINYGISLIKSDSLESPIDFTPAKTIQGQALDRIKYEFTLGEGKVKIEIEKEEDSNYFSIISSGSIPPFYKKVIRAKVKRNKNETEIIYWKEER